MAEHRIVVPGVVGSSPITHPIKKEISSDISFFIWYLVSNGTRIIQCNADERCRRRLDGAEHLFSPRAKMQTSPLPKSDSFTRSQKCLRPRFDPNGKFYKKSTVWTVIHTALCFYRIIVLVLAGFPFFAAACSCDLFVVWV